MNSLSKILVILVFAGLFTGVYAASVNGFGVGDLRDQETMAQVKKECPDYYQNRNGECLGRTFRSFYLVRGLRGGGPGFGK